MKSGNLFVNRTFQLFALLLLAVGLNLNTLFNDYALDDIVVMTENKFVRQGINGIPEILTTDLMQGYSTKTNLLEQARYRPLSIVLFAIEYEFFGAVPFISHLINVLLFALLIALLFQLLNSHIFKESDGKLAFITCLLFTVHPIHTEVIANVKSRDELIAFILLILSLKYFIKYDRTRIRKFLFMTLIFFFLALLTRESAVTFMAVVPLIMYFFFNKTIRQATQYSLILLPVFAVYFLIRMLIIGLEKPVVTDVLNSPFLYASAAQAIATKFYILLKYLWILILPHPLSSDYSYNQIPYVNLNSPQFILAALILGGLVFYAISTFKKRSILSFSILYFMATISVASNMIVDIGTPFSERLLFQPSLGICIAGAAFFWKGYRQYKLASGFILISIITLFSFKTIARNSDWKNNATLYEADVVSAPNSARTTLFASEIYRDKAKTEKNPKLKNEYSKKAIYYGERSLEIYSDYAVTHLHTGFAYYDVSDYEKAADHWIKGYQLDPLDPEAKKCIEVLSIVFYKKGNGFYEQGEIEAAKKSYQRSVELNENNAEAWYNLGGMYFLLKDTNLADMAWQKVNKLAPDRTINKNEFIIN